MNVTSNGVQIRVPAVANLMVDSADRPDADTSSPWDFLISKNQSLFNGFFTRIGATEVVLEWKLPNINTIFQNNNIQFTVNNGQVINVLVDSNFYNVQELLDWFVNVLNAQTTAARFAILDIGGRQGIVDTAGDPIIIGVAPGGSDKLQRQIRLVSDATRGTDFVYPYNPDLRPYRYIDFVSSQLTYNQNLKDSTTNLIDQNVLVRWYMAYDSPTPADGYGFPILMGYEPFNLRRLYNPPKQIAWENNMPIGQLAFQVIGSDNKILPSTFYNSDWLMTLQISEN